MTSYETFSALSLDEKHTFIRSRRLCFGCLRYGHSNRDCQRRLRCSKCDRQHPTVLHDDKRQQQSNFSQVAPLMPPIQSDSPHDHISKRRPQFSFKIQKEALTHFVHRFPPNKDLKLQPPNKVNTTHVPISQHISAMIVPFYLSHKSCPDQNKLVYAMLD